MVDEKFKLSIDFDIEQSSLADLQRQIERTVKQAFDNAAKSAQLKAPRGPAAGPTPATARSVREAVSVSGADLGKAVRQALRDELKGFEGASKRVENALNKLTKAIETSRTSARTGAAKGPREVLAAKQQGPSNQQRGANVDATRRAGSERTAGSTAANVVADAPRKRDRRVGTEQDRPNFGRSAQRQVQAREQRGAGMHTRSAEATVANVAKSINRLEAAIRSMPQFKDIDLGKALGLPRAGQVRVGRGAAPEVTTPAGQTKVITRFVKIIGDQLEEASDVVTQRINALLSSGRMKEIQKAAVRRPERAQAMLREEVRGIMNLPKGGGRAVMGGFQKAGQAEMVWKPSAEQAKRITAHKDDAARIAEANAILSEMTKKSEAFAKAGLEVVSVLGLAEDEAASLNVKMKQTGEVFGTVQTRNLAQQGVGGAGAMRQARSFLVTQAQQIVGGETPKIKGVGEEAAYAGKIFAENAVKHLKTAVVSADMIPTLKEDQILMDVSAAKKMGMMQDKALMAYKKAEDIVPGMALQHGQVMGETAEGKPVTFDLKGASAEVKRIEEVIIDGVQAWKIHYEELNEMITGGKISTTAGHKGIVKVEKDLAGKYGFPAGTEVAVGAEGMAKRGDLRDMITMHASNIAEATKTSGQQVADMIVERMKHGSDYMGQTLDEAITGVAQELGLGGYTGATRMTKGPLAAAMGGVADITAGELPWMRLAKEGQRGPAKIEERFADMPAIKALEQRAETATQAKEMQKRMQEVAEQNQELIKTLQVLAGVTDVASEKLETLLPEQIKALPAGTSKPEALEGTLLDPSMAKAMGLAIPTRGGGARALRVPEAGVGLGMRGKFTTQVGTVGADPITKLFDKIVQQATQIRAATGEIDIAENAEAYQEAANITARALKDQVQQIYKLGTKTDEGKAAMKKFIDTFGPMVEGLEGASIAFRKLKASGEGVEESIPAGRYLRSRKTQEQKMLAIQDIMAERAAKKTPVHAASKMGREGFVATESVRAAGAIFDPKNINILQEAMESLGVTLSKDAKHVDALHSRLEKLEEQLVSTLAAEGFGRNKPAQEAKRRMAQTMGAGISPAPIGTAIEFRTDAAQELEDVRQRLLSLRAAGQNVDDAFAALDRMAALQVGDALPRDAVLLSAKDYDNLMRATMREQGIGAGEAQQRMQRGMALRYPVTGGQSFQVVKILKDLEGKLPEGKIGVSGPMAVSSPEDLAAMLEPLNQFRSSLLKTIEASGGQGAAAEQARAQLKALNPVIEGLRQKFVSATMNLDFDGDKIAVHAALSEQAAKDMRTFTETVRAGGMSFENIMNNILTGSAGPPGGGMGGVGDFAATFAKTVKGRTGALKSAVLAPDDPATAQFEAQAHVSAKKSVGLLTDAFNKLEVAILGGATDTGDAFATGMERFMLFINKALAQKHGQGGAAGPLEFAGAMAKGPAGLREIFSGMDKEGDDVFGELGKFNKQYRAQMREALVAQPLETIKQLGREIGALDESAEIGPENFKGTIDAIVDKADLKGQMKRMWSMLEANMREALSREGMKGGAIDAAMKKMLSPDIKTGDIKGVDINKIIEQLFPGYGATRSAAEKRIAGLPAMDQARKVLQLAGVEIAESIEGIANEFEIEGDPRESLKVVAAEIKAWLESWQDSFKEIRQEQFRGLTGMDPKTAGAARGLHKGGQIYMSSEKVVQPVREAVAALQMLARGDIDDIPGVLKQVTKALSGFASTLAHEGIHQASKEWTTSVENIVRGLQSGTGAIGKQSTEIIQKASKIPNIAKAFEGLKALQSQQKIGITEVAGGKDIRAAIGEKTQSIYRLIAEELMAYRTDPEMFTKRFGELADDTVEAIDEALGNLAAAKPRVIKAAMEGGQQLTHAVTEAFEAAFSGRGVDVAGVRAATEDAGRRLMQADFPGREKHLRTREILQKGEETLAMGREVWGLTPGVKKGGKLGLGADISMIGEDLLPEIVPQLKETLRKAFSGDILDPAQAGELEKVFREQSSAYIGGLKELAQSGQLQGVKPFKEYEKVQREWQAAQAQALINRSRELEKTIQSMQEAGQTEIPEFRDKIEEFEKTVGRLFRLYEQGLELKGAGRGRLGGLAATPDQLISDPAVGMGLKVPTSSFTGMMQAGAGRGKQEFARFEHMVEPMEELLNAIQQGHDYTKQWNAVWEALEDKPEYFAENMTKISDILSKWAKAEGLNTALGSESATNLDRLAKSAKEADKAMRKLQVPPKTADEIASLAAGDKAFGKARTRGKEGGLVKAVEAQVNAARAEAKRLQKELTEALQAGLDVGRHFEPKKIDIIHPRTGDVLQRLEINVKRFGKTAQVSMKQAGRATQEFGGHMQSALRRVVQWGFATGIVYGTIRAFRNFIQVITDVETKITALKKVMDTSVTDFEAMQNAATGFGREFGVAIEEVLDGMVVYGQQGLKMNEIMERTRGTMLAVNVTTLSATEATEALTASHKVFGDAVANSTGFVDAWAAVAAKHAITAKDLADAVKRSGAAAEVAGVGFEDFMGIVTAIGAVTRQTGKEIATSTKFMFRAMRRPTAQKELGKMGIQSMNRAGDFRPAMDIMKELAGRWDSLTRAQQVNTAQAMAGIRHYNSFIVLMNNFDEALLASADAANSQGFAMRKNRIAMQTVSKQIQVMKESLKTLALEVGKGMLPIMQSTIKAVTSLVQVANKLPEPFLKFGVLAAGGVIAVHKALDLVLDTIEIGFGSRMATKIGERGIFGGMKDMAKGGVAGAKSFGAAFAGGEAVGKLGSAGAGAAKGVGMLQKGLVGMTSSASRLIPALAGVAVAIEGMSLAAIATGIGAILVALGAATVAFYKWYQAGNRAGSEVEAALEDVIGKSEDTASALRSQKTQADRLILSQKKMNQAFAKMDSPDLSGMQEALDEGRYKSAARAAQAYADKIASISESIAFTDPAAIQGVDEFGNYVLGVNEQFKALTTSALDAQNAITTAMKGDVIKAYVSDLKEAKGWWDDLVETMAGIADVFLPEEYELNVDRSLLGKLTAARDKLNELAKAREELAEKGMVDILGGDALIEQAREYQKLQKETLKVVSDIKRVFEAMPTFESPKEAARAFEKISDEIAFAAEQGAFGKGATVGTAATAYMAKNMGLGGIVDYKAAMSPAMVHAAFAERGIRGLGRQEMGPGGAVGLTKAGELTVVSREVAEALLKGFGTQATDVAVKEAQVLTSRFDSVSGQMVFQMFDSVSQEFRDIPASMVEGVVAGLEGREGEIADHFMRFSKESVDQAIEATRKMTTLQFTGALAGLRQPLGGMPNIGPGRRSEMSAEQRMLEDVPDTLQRLSEVQLEFNQLTKQYSEDILSDVEGAYNRQSKSGQAFKVMTQDVLQQAMRLQKEGFELSKIAHFSKALQELNMLMESAARAAEQAAREEALRQELMVETGGAMAGSAFTEVDLGKTFRELSAQQQLAQTSPAFREMAVAVKRAEAARERDFQTLIEVTKKEDEFKELVKSLDEAGSRLDAEQIMKGFELEKAGASKGEAMMIQQLEKQDSTLQAMMGDGNAIGEKQVDLLQDIRKLLATPEADRAAFLAGREGEEAAQEQTAAMKQLFEVAGGRLGAENLRQMMMSTVGLKEGEGGMVEAAYELSPELTKLRETIMAQINTLKRSAPGGRAAGEYTIPLPTGGTNLAGRGFEKLFGKEDLSGIFPEQVMARDVEDATRIINETWQEIIATTPEFAMRFREQMLATLPDPAAAVPAEAGEGVDDAEELAKMRAEGHAAMQEFVAQQAAAEQQLKNNINQSNDSLMALKSGMRLSESIQKFAITLEGIVREAEKAEMLHYEKVKSDIEGPFARVGQPGFKTSFEQRREEIEARRGGPRSLEQMRQDAKDLAAVEYDEKEARIKQQQDIEVAALRQQQSQAESFRGAMADALLSGEFAGTGMENVLQRNMEQLTQQLATSEQAEMRGGELMFKGIPALEDMKKFVQQMKQEAAAKAAEEEKQRMIEANQPVVDATNQQTQILGAKLDSLAGAFKIAGEKMGPEAPYSAPGLAGEPGAGRAGLRSLDPFNIIPKDTKGPVDFNQYYHGPSNSNQVKDWKSRSLSGNATATTSATVNTATAAGQRRTPGAEFNEERRVPGEGTNAATETSTAIAESITQLADTLNTLASEGIRLPDDFTSAITELGTTFTDALGETISVELAETPEVSVNNLSEITDAFESAGLAGVGAEISDIGLRLTEVEGLAATGGALDTKIDEGLTDIQDQLDEAMGTRDSLAAAITDIEATLEEIDPDTITELVDQSAVFEASITDIDERVSTVEASVTDITDTTIPALTDRIDVVEATVEDFDSRIETVEVEVADALVQVADVVTTVTELEQTVAASNELATTAQELATETQNSLTTFRAEVESQRQTVEASIREVESTVRTNETDRQADKREIQRIAGIAEGANTKADNALSLAQAARRI